MGIQKDDEHRILGFSNPGIRAPLSLFTARLGTPLPFIDPFRNLNIPQERFEIDPVKFLAIARSRRPRHPVATASCFAAWVHSLYAPLKEKNDLEEGARAERFIYEARRAYMNSERVWRSTTGDWLVEFVGLALDETDCPNIPGIDYYEIPNLKVLGQPVRAKPDLVYRDAATGNVLIIEIKFSCEKIPLNLWPDIWAQLWVYSKIPLYSTAPSVTTIGEIWGDDRLLSNRYFGFYESWRVERKGVFLRALVRRDPRAAPFDRFFQKLFDIYAHEDVQ